MTGAVIINTRWMAETGCELSTIDPSDVHYEVPMTSDRLRCLSHDDGDDDNSPLLQRYVFFCNKTTAALGIFLKDCQRRMSWMTSQTYIKDTQRTPRLRKTVCG